MRALVSNAVAKTYLNWIQKERKGMKGGPRNPRSIRLRTNFIKFLFFFFFRSYHKVVWFVRAYRPAILFSVCIRESERRFSDHIKRDEKCCKRIFIFPLAPCRHGLWVNYHSNELTKTIHTVRSKFLYVFEGAKSPFLLIVVFLLPLRQVVRAASPALLRLIILGAFFIYCTVRIYCLSLPPSFNLIT